MITNFFNTAKNLLLEQDSKLMTLRKAITDKLPVSIYYSGPPGEVLSGQRIDILPIVLGTKADSGNLVIWAFTFKGVSKKGLPGWKMFRVDRIKSIKLNSKLSSFDLDKLPGYIEGKAPDAMKSLSSVEVYSPYWKEKPEEIPTPTEPTPEKPEEPERIPTLEPTIPTQPEEPEEIPTPTEPGPVEEPDSSPMKYRRDVQKTLQTKIKDINGSKIISQQDYDEAINNLRKRKEDEWRTYQKMITGNVRPGEGTRKRFDNTSQMDVDHVLSKNNISVSNETPEPLAEAFKRFKVLINL